MKLEFKYIAPYLPYQLEAIDEYNKKRIIDWECQSYTNTIVGLNHVIHSQSVQVNCFKPLLKLLKNLNKEDIVKLKLFTEADKQYLINNPLSCSYEDVQYLLSKHYDVFNLIEKELAVEII